MPVKNDVLLDEEPVFEPSLEPFSQGHATPDPEVVKALMHCVTSGVWSPSDGRREEGHLGTEILESAVMRHPDKFFPPERFVLDGTNIRRDSILFWRQMADSLLWKAQGGAYSDSNMAVLTEKRRVGIQRVRKGHAIHNRQEGLYFDIDTGAAKSAEISREVAKLVNEVKGLMRKALENVLSDRAEVDRVVKNAQVYRKIIIDVVFADIIERMDYIRSRVEKPGDLRKFLETLNNAVRALATDPELELNSRDLEVDVISLSSRDAVVYGCQGLYVPEEERNNAKVCIPMTRYGTNQPIEFDQVLETLAHEVAHHLTRKHPIMTAGRGERAADHDFHHTYWTDLILRRLRSYDFRKDGSVKNAHGGATGQAVPRGLAAAGTVDQAALIREVSPGLIRSVSPELIRSVSPGLIQAVVPQAVTKVVDEAVQRVVDKAVPRVSEDVSSHLSQIGSIAIPPRGIERVNESAFRKWLRKLGIWE